MDFINFPKRIKVASLSINAILLLWEMFLILAIKYNRDMISKVQHMEDKTKTRNYYFI